MSCRQVLEAVDDVGVGRRCYRRKGEVSKCRFIADRPSEGARDRRDPTRFRRRTQPRDMVGGIGAGGRGSEHDGVHARLDLAQQLVLHLSAP